MTPKKAQDLTAQLLGLSKSSTEQELLTLLRRIANAIERLSFVIEQQKR